MKIISWNCNMAFRRKAEFILRLEPDILIVQECECPDKLMFPSGLPKPTSMLWYGSNQNKVIGIFSYSHYRFTVLHDYNEDLKLIVPISVTGGQFDFNLFAIWANNPADKDGQYIEQVWKSIHHYDKYLTNERTLLVGDFNSNTIWDKEHRQSSHSHVVIMLEEKGIRHKDKAYHIDYCFASADLMAKLQSLAIGEYKSWNKYSDHTPVIVTFDNC